MEVLRPIVYDWQKTSSGSFFHSIGSVCGRKRHPPSSKSGKRAPLKNTLCTPLPPQPLPGSRLRHPHNDMPSIICRNTSFSGSVSPVAKATLRICVGAGNCAHQLQQFRFCHIFCKTANSLHAGPASNISKANTGF